MPPSARLLGPLEAVSSKISSALYVCSTCRRQFRPQCLRAVVANQQFRRHNSNGPDRSFTERMRKRLWGTDTPPGMKDPYGGESAIEKTLREKEGKEPEKAGESKEAAEEELTEEEAIASGEYVPATTWDGLNRVGTVGKWEEVQPTDHDEFFGFMTTEKLSTRDEMATAMHQVTVELAILKQLNKPLDSICCIPSHSPHIITLINETAVKPSEDLSTGILTFPSDDAKNELFELFNDPEAAVRAVEDEEAVDWKDVEVDTEESEDVGEDADFQNIDEAMKVKLRVPTDLDFLSISLRDPEFKFAFLKRTAQVTGHRIIDPEIIHLTSVSRLFAYLLETARPKPAKLADKLSQDGRLLALPNVKIFSRRQTPIDKEKEVGRWKVIEEELTRLGLPVTGRGEPR